jgi:fused signal recognition particle receptor
MFDSLRKRISDAVKGLIKKEEERSEEQAQQDTLKEDPESATASEEKELKDEPEGPEARKRPVQNAKRDDLIKLSLKTKIKSALVGKIRLDEKEIGAFLDTLRISMLESDVSYDTTEQFVSDLHSKLTDRRIDSRNIRKEIIETVRGSLLAVLYNGDAVNIDEFVASKKRANDLPVKILFLGPNGAGKTTTIAKISNHFKSKGMTNVLSASDTFRAAAIEQIEHHAKRLGVPVIKSNYGADPASIAFDSIAYARAHRIDLVLIDSAGRQETNRSLINEIQKMVRVAKPDLTIFVGESTSGNMIAEQIREFNKFVKIDGIILTKLDCDAKGGGALSISHTTGIPILFFGIGEKYDAIIPYDPNYVVNAILPEEN